MKIRSGFVSNSSSSSFVCFGKYNVNVPDYSDCDVFEAFEESLEKSGLEIHEDDESGTCIGVDPDEMRDDETLLQFKKRIAERMNKIGIATLPNELGFTGGTSYN